MYLFFELQSHRHLFYNEGAAEEEEDRLRSHSYVFDDEDAAEEEEDGDLDAETADLILPPIPVMFWFLITVTCLIICARNLMSILRR